HPPAHLRWPCAARLLPRLPLFPCAPPRPCAVLQRRRPPWPFPPEQDRVAPPTAPTPARRSDKVRSSPPAAVPFRPPLPHSPEIATVPSRAAQLRVLYGLSGLAPRRPGRIVCSVFQPRSAARVALLSRAASPPSGACAIDQYRDDTDFERQRRRNLDGHEIVRVVEPATAISSFASSQLGPMTAKNTSHAATWLFRYSRKSTPAGMWSTSIKRFLRPNVWT